MGKNTERSVSTLKKYYKAGVEKKGNHTPL